MNLRKMPDYRLPENRRECFERYYVAQLKSWDIDPAYPSLNWLFEKYHLSKEQQYWLAFLYGCYYECDSVAYTFFYFPQYPLNMTKFEDWHSKNWRRLLYETDRRHCKGHMVEMLDSYVRLVGKSQQAFFESFMTGHPKADFDRLWDVLKAKLKFFGRYSLFFYTETLKRCCGLPIECSSLMLGRDGVSHTQGLHWVYGLERAEHSCELWDKKYLKDLSYLADILLINLKRKYPELRDVMDYWSFETSLCAFKGLYRRHRYMGYYIDRGERDHLSFLKNVNGKALPIDSLYCHKQLVIDEADFYEMRKDIHPHCYLGELNDWSGVRNSLKDKMLDGGELVDITKYIEEQTYAKE